MGRTGRRRALGLLLLLGVLGAAAAQAHFPEPVAAIAVNATSEVTTPEEEADDAGGIVASEGVCVPPMPASPTRLQGKETSEVAAEEDGRPSHVAAEAGGITPVEPGQQWEPAVAENDTASAINDTAAAAGGALAEEEAEQHNFALEKDGAKVIAANREAKKVQALLDDDSDTYLKNDCRADKWFILELVQVAKVNRFELSQFELYSSRVKEFEVRGRQSHPRTDGVEYSRGLDSPAWKLLGSYSAEKSKGTQSFGVDPTAWVRYLLVRFVSHHGSEPVCALNAFSVFGKSAAEELEDQLASEDPLDYLGSLAASEEPEASLQPAGNDSKPVAEDGAAAPAANGSSSSEAPGPREGSGEGQVPADMAQGNSSSSSMAEAPSPTGPTDSEGPPLEPTGAEEVPAADNVTQAGHEAEEQQQQPPAREQPPAHAGAVPAAGEVPAAEEAVDPADNATAAPAAAPAAAAAAAVDGSGEVLPAPAVAEKPPATGPGDASQPGSPHWIAGDPPPEQVLPKATPPPAAAAAAAGKDAQPGALSTSSQQPAAGNGGHGANGGGAAAIETLEDLPLNMRPSRPKGSASIYEILVQEIKGAKVGQKLLAKGLADLQRNLSALQADTGAELAVVAAQLSKLVAEAEAAAAHSEPELNHRLEVLVRSHLLEVAEDVRVLQAAAAGAARREHAALSLLAMLAAVFALSMPGFARDWPRVKLVVAALAVGNGLVGLLLHIRSSGTLAPSLRALA